jgi:hypothetical protein
MHQITFGNMNVTVQNMPDGSGRALIMQENAVAPGLPSGDTYILPLPTEVAELIGKQLSAPSLHVATNADVQAIRRDP